MRVVMGFIFKGDELLLILHKRKDIWLPVGGHVEKGETDVQALKREIKEETNLEVEIDKKPFFILKEKSEITSHYICIYFGGEIKINKAEISDYKWFTKDKILNFDLIVEIKRLSLQAFRLKWN